MYTNNYKPRTNYILYKETEMIRNKILGSTIESMLHFVEYDLMSFL